MRWDDDKTLITLFDNNYKPHVVVTYSPNIKKISSPEGVARSQIKSKYYKYVLDLAKLLDVDLEAKEHHHLTLKYNLRELNAKIKRISSSKRDIWSEYSEVQMNGKIYYANNYSTYRKLYSEEVITKVLEFLDLFPPERKHGPIKKKSLKNLTTSEKMASFFHPSNQSWETVRRLKKDRSLILLPQDLDKMRENIS